MPETFVDITDDVKKLWAISYLKQLGYLDETGYHLGDNADSDGVRVAYYWSKGEHLRETYPEIRGWFHETDPDFVRPPWK